MNGERKSEKKTGARRKKGRGEKRTSDEKKIQGVANRMEKRKRKKEKL